MVSVSTNWLNAWKIVFSNYADNEREKFLEKSTAMTAEDYLGDLLGLKLSDGISVADDDYDFLDNESLQQSKPTRLDATLTLFKKVGNALIKDDSWKAPFRAVKAIGNLAINGSRILTEVLPLWAHLHFKNAYADDHTLAAQQFKRSKHASMTVQNDHTSQPELFASSNEYQLPKEPLSSRIKNLGSRLKKNANKAASRFFLGIHLAGRAITSPRVSLEWAWDYGNKQGGVFYAIFLTAASFLFTTVMYTLMLPFIIKALAFAAPEVIVSAVNTFTIFIASQSGLFSTIGNFIAGTLGSLTTILNVSFTPTLWLYAASIATVLNLGFLLERAYNVFKAGIENLFAKIKEMSVIETTTFHEDGKTTTRPGEQFGFGATATSSSAINPDVQLYKPRNTVMVTSAATGETFNPSPTPSRTNSTNFEIAREHAKTQYGTQNKPTNQNSSEEKFVDLEEFSDEDVDTGVHDNKQTVARGHAGTAYGVELLNQSKNIQQELQRIDQQVTQAEETLSSPKVASGLFESQNQESSNMQPKK